MGVLIARAHGIDLRKVGSGNIGATNLFRALGAKWGLIGFALDTLKGLLPTLCCAWLGLHGWALGAPAVALVVGHCYSPYLRFAGGKGVATSLGVALALFWPAGLIPFLLWIGVTAVSRYVSLGSVVALPTAPVIAALLGASGPEVAAMAVAAVLCVVRHAENLERLVQGTENRLGRRKAPPSEEDTQP